MLLADQAKAMDMQTAKYISCRIMYSVGSNASYGAAFPLAYD